MLSFIGSVCAPDKATTGLWYTRLMFFKHVGAVFLGLGTVDTFYTILLFFWYWNHPHNIDGVLCCVCGLVSRSRFGFLLLREDILVFSLLPFAYDSHLVHDPGSKYS